MFWRLLGTADGGSTSGGADPRRTALFAVWQDEAALESFVDEHPIADRWARAEEAWHVRLRSLGGHGRWRGVDVLDGLARGEAGGPVAVITRAYVRLSAWREFRRTRPGVDTELHGAPGLLDVVGVGEAPVARMATFSLWQSAEDARRFAYGMPRHRGAVEQSRARGWFSEEMFARFEPYGSTGLWDARDPLQQEQPVV